MKLSVITIGRNDNYGQNFLQRLKHNINSLIHNVEKIGADDIEIIVVDWGSTKKLSDILPVKKYPFLKFLHIPKEICDKYVPSSNFSIVHSFNSGFRKSKGEYILTLDGDGFIDYSSFEKLYNFIKNEDLSKKFFWGSRIHIPFELHSSTDDISIINEKIEDWKINHSIWTVDKINTQFFRGCAMGFLIHRDIYEECSGFYEKLTGWGWLDIEIHNRLVSKYTFAGDLYDMGIWFFHLNHHSFPSDVPWGNGEYSSPYFKSNGDDWGLVNENLNFE